MLEIVLFNQLEIHYENTHTPPAYLLTCLPAYLLTCLPAYLLTCLPAYLLTCLPAYLLSASIACAAAAKIEELQRQAAPHAVAVAPAAAVSQFDDEAYYHKLGTGTNTPFDDEAHFRDLQSRAAAGDLGAQSLMNHNVYQGREYWSRKSLAERVKYLEDRAKVGDRDAAGRLYGAVSDGKLIWEGKSLAEREAYLEQKAKEGNQMAQETLIMSAYNGSYTAAGKPAEERRAYIEKLAATGNEFAKERLKYAAMDRMLETPEQTRQIEEAGFKEHEAQANAGDVDMQRSLVYNVAFGRGGYYDRLSASDREAYLEKRAKEGDKYAAETLQELRASRP